MFFSDLVTFSPVSPHFVKVLQPIRLVIIPGKATFAAALSNKCLVATREEEGHFKNRKVLLLYFFCIQISQICNGTKVIAITPHFVRYAIHGGLLYSMRCGWLLQLFVPRAMREPECRIICNRSPHLFYKQVRIKGKDRLQHKVISCNKTNISHIPPRIS